MGIMVTTHGGAVKRSGSGDDVSAMPAHQIQRGVEKYRWRLNGSWGHDNVLVTEIA